VLVNTAIRAQTGIRYVLLSNRGILMTAVTILVTIECISLAFLIESAVKFTAMRMTKRRMLAERLVKLTAPLSKYER
jgi:hypothetical protein